MGWLFSEDPDHDVSGIFIPLKCFFFAVLANFLTQYSPLECDDLHTEENSNVEKIGPKEQKRRYSFLCL